MSSPIIVNNAPELSPEQNVINIYLLNKITTDIQDFVNLISIVYGIRNGGILGIHSSAFNKFKEACEAIGISVRKYPMGDESNVILVRGADSKLLDSLPHLVETNKPEFHRLTGELIGYFEPYNVFNKDMSATKKSRVAIEVVLKNYTGKVEKTEIFAQRVSSTDPYKSQLETMADAMRSLNPDVYLPYKLVSVNVVTTQLGGKKRKSRRKSKGLRRKSSRKTRGSS